MATDSPSEASDTLITLSRAAVQDTFIKETDKMLKLVLSMCFSSPDGDKCASFGRGEGGDTHVSLGGGGVVSLGGGGYPLVAVGLYLSWWWGCISQWWWGLYLSVVVGLYLSVVVGLYLSVVVGLYLWWGCISWWGVGYLNDEHILLICFLFCMCGIHYEHT
jgi:hypothetical protein